VDLYSAYRLRKTFNVQIEQLLKDICCYTAGRNARLSLVQITSGGIR